MNVDTFIAAARACLGTPFRHQGRIPGRGLDCVGVVVHAARAAGFDLIDNTRYGRSPCRNMLQAALDAQPALCHVTDRQPGDILLMRFAGEPQHLAVLTDDNTIVHAYASIEKVCEQRLAQVWAARIVRAYRLTGLTAVAS